MFSCHCVIPCFLSCPLCLFLVMSLCLISLSCLHVPLMLSFYVSPVCIVLSCIFSQAHHEYLPLPLCPSVSVSSLLNVSALPLFVSPLVVSQVRLDPMCIPLSQLLCQVVLISLLLSVSCATLTVLHPVFSVFSFDSSVLLCLFVPAMLPLLSYPYIVPVSLCWFVHGSSSGLMFGLPGVLVLGLVCPV